MLNILLFDVYSGEAGKCYRGSVPSCCDYSCSDNVVYYMKRLETSQHAKVAAVFVLLHPYNCTGVYIWCY